MVSVPDSDPRKSQWHKKKINEIMSCFKELDVLSGGLDASSEAVASLQGGTNKYK